METKLWGTGQGVRLQPTVDQGQWAAVRERDNFLLGRVIWDVFRGRWFGETVIGTTSRALVSADEAVDFLLQRE